MTEEKKLTPENVNKYLIQNPKVRIVEDLKRRNINNMHRTAGEYFNGKYTYAQTFEMIDDYKKAFLSIDGITTDGITICAPSTIASVNAFYAAIDANKVANLMPPSFLNIYTERYTTGLNSKTVFIYSGFLSDELIGQLHRAGVKNLIVTEISDYMPAIVKWIAAKKGMISKERWVDKYVKTHGAFPQGMHILTVPELSELGVKSKSDYRFPYEENRLAARFLTGATTSELPKCVEMSEDGINMMACMYEHFWFPMRGRLGVFIPIYYATGAIHGIYGGHLNGMTCVYKPKYDRFTFGKDLLDSKINMAVVAPSHVAALEKAGLQNGALSFVETIFIGGEAIPPAQMGAFRKASQCLGIKHIINGYGMTETGSMSGYSQEGFGDPDDVSIVPIPGVRYRIVDPGTGKELPDNVRGVLQVLTPSAAIGYYEKEKNTQLFTEDGWVNTGDIAERFPNGHYRVFGRSTDCFTNGGSTYYMFDIEEKVLEVSAISEAEVIKYEVDGEEYPAIVAVLRCNMDAADALLQICAIDAPGMTYLIGVCFIDNFKTNPVTSKRDYRALKTDCTSFFSTDNGKYFLSDVSGRKKEISATEVCIKKA